MPMKTTDNSRANRAAACLLSEYADAGTDAVTDLLTDLQYHCETQGIDFDECKRIAGDHFTAETKGDL